MLKMMRFSPDQMPTNRLIIMWTARQSLFKHLSNNVLNIRTQIEIGEVRQVFQSDKVAVVLHVDV